MNVPKDTDKFPFGRHKNAGHTYAEVPAKDLDWMAGQEWIDDWPEVVAYINANRKAIDKDLEEE